MSIVDISSNPLRTTRLYQNARINLGLGQYVHGLSKLHKNGRGPSVALPETTLIFDGSWLSLLWNRACGKFSYLYLKNVTILLENCPVQLDSKHIWKPLGEIHTKPAKFSSTTTETETRRIFYILENLYFPRNEFSVQANFHIRRTWNENIDELIRFMEKCTLRTVF